MNSPIQAAAQEWEWVCECGDWVSDHVDAKGRCVICPIRPYGMKPCKTYRPAGPQRRLTLRSDEGQTAMNRAR